LQADYATLLRENNSLEAEVERTQSDLTNVQADYDALKADYDALKADYDTLKADHDALKADYNSLQTDYGIVEKKLSEIAEVYPVKNFPNAEVLEAWLAEQPNPPKSVDAILWLFHALQLQEKALEDGYIINVEIISAHYRYYTVLCTAILEDNSYYYWDPETDEIYYWLNVTHFHVTDLTDKPGPSSRDVWP